jgi:hypothetical protein
MYSDFVSAKNTVSHIALYRDRDKLLADTGFKQPIRCNNAVLMKDFSLHSGQKWIIGWTYSTVSNSNFPGEDKYGFGIGFDGHIWWDGYSVQFCRSLQHAQV